MLQSQGRASLMLVRVLRQIAPTLADLGARLERPGAAFLDVGTGVGWLAIAMAEAFPRLRVVGIDVFAPALRLATENRSGLKLESHRARVELRAQDVTALDEQDAFDAVFLPGPFLPQAVVPSALQRVRAALREGGWVLFGLYTSLDEPLAERLTDLRVVRSGGHPWTPAEIVATLEGAGFGEVRVLDRSWPMPVTFAVGRRVESPATDPT